MCFFFEWVYFFTSSKKKNLVFIVVWRHGIFFCITESLAYSVVSYISMWMSMDRQLSKACLGFHFIDVRYTESRLWRACFVLPLWLFPFWLTPFPSHFAWSLLSSISHLCGWCSSSNWSTEFSEQVVLTGHFPRWQPLTHLKEVQYSSPS